MQVDDLTAINPNIDISQILPIHQKRTIAFINHFVMNTVSFLNHFSQSCESRLMEFEKKLDHIEASLMILESQLSSISGLEDEIAIEKIALPSVQMTEDVKPEIPEEPVVTTNIESDTKEEKLTPANDPRYEKFFKMIQFGVPPAAVKLKMQTEGIDPNILDS